MGTSIRDLAPLVFGAPRPPVNWQQQGEELWSEQVPGSIPMPPGVEMSEETAAFIEEKRRAAGERFAAQKAREAEQARTRNMSPNEEGPGGTGQLESNDGLSGGAQLADSLGRPRSSGLHEQATREEAARREAQDARFEGWKATYDPNDNEKNYDLGGVKHPNAPRQAQHIARAWARDEYQRNREYYDSMKMGPLELQELWHETQGLGGGSINQGPLSNWDTRTALQQHPVINAAKAWRDKVQPQGMSRTPLAQRQANVAERTAQYEIARRTGAHPADVMASRDLATAQDPWQLEQRTIANNVAFPSNPALAGNAVNLTNARGLANAAAAEAAGRQRPGEQTPIQALQQVQQDIAATPFANLTAAIAGNHPIIGGNTTYPAFFTTQGRARASEAALKWAYGENDPDAVSFMHEWTKNYVAAGNPAHDRRSYEGWLQQLGLPNSQETQNLWQKITNHDPRKYGTAWNPFGWWNNYWGDDEEVPRLADVLPKR